MFDTEHPDFCFICSFFYTASKELFRNIQKNFKVFQMFIISDHFEEINRRIQSETLVGATLLHAKTGYLGKEEDVILCAVRPKEIKDIRDLIRTIDPNAFITMSNVTKVYGSGFSIEPTKISVYLFFK